MSAIAITIVSQGKEMDPAYGLLSLEVTKELNRVASAQLQLSDGDAAEGKFAISDGGFFEPGKQIEIKLGHVGERDATVFKGVVVRHGIESSSDSSVLRVELKDAAQKLTFGRKSAVYRDQSDDEIIKKILNNAGVDVGDIDSTKPKHAELVQYYATDWDFVLSRADVQGLVVIVDEGKVSVKEMRVSGGHKIELKYGLDDIYSLNVEMDATDQQGEIESVGWDIKELKSTSASKAKPVTLSQGNVDAGGLARKVGGKTYTLSHIVPMSSQELQAWADARMARSRLSMIRGKIAVPGRADIKLLDRIKLTSVGERFSGTTTVTGVSHHVDGGVWKTEIQFGLDPAWFSRREHIAEVPASGLLPPVSGLQIGIVDEFEDDPDDELRVKVLLPSIDEKSGAVWARLATPDAGKDRGLFFRPEPGDEVVVGFFNSDPRQPVILGSMFGSKNNPPDFVKEPTDKNIKKAIITKKGTTIGFVDEDKASVFIETKNKQKILLDDDKAVIEVSDQHGNSIKMNEDGVSIHSAKDLKIEAKGQIDIKSSGSFNLKTDATANIKASKVDVR